MDIQTINLNWLRSNIGLVSQEPVLFDTTIEENICLGKQNATSEEMIEAATKANLRNFLEVLPRRYSTAVGEKGAQMSGGQKQRIAIARALIRNPRILLLDEATSALDTKTETLVQEALNRESRGRTTIIIAHRLSTIRNADLIVAIDSGRVSEMGTHDDLMARRGLYYELVMAQVSVCVA